MLALQAQHRTGLRFCSAAVIITVEAGDARAG